MGIIIIIIGLLIFFVPIHLLCEWIDKDRISVYHYYLPFNIEIRNLIEKKFKLYRPINIYKECYIYKKKVWICNGFQEWQESFIANSITFKNEGLAKIFFNKIKGEFIHKDKY